MMEKYTKSPPGLLLALKYSEYRAKAGNIFCSANTKYFLYLAWFEKIMN